MDVRHRSNNNNNNNNGAPVSPRGAGPQRAISNGKTMTAPSRAGGSLSGLVILGMTAVVVVATIGSLVFFRTIKTGPPLLMRGGSSSLKQPSAVGDLENLVDRSLYEQIQKENKALQKKIIEIKKSKVTEAHVASTVDQKDFEKLTKAVDRLADSRRLLHERIQTISKRALLSKYGPGPHYVELTLSFDPDSNIADPSKTNSGGVDTESLLILLAPEDEMPATVFHFLEQVNETLYDGASFHRNAGHVVQGGPTPNFESRDGNKNLLKGFKTTGLEHVPFQEYSPNFPHVQYTLGYAGRPGGPDFYISTLNNSKNHGPGGQGSYDDPSEADPCFAKVVEGYEPVVQRLHRSDVEPGNYKRMSHFVAIRSVRHLPVREALNKISAKKEDAVN